MTGVTERRAVSSLSDMPTVSAARLSPEMGALPISITLWEVAGDDFALVDFNATASQHSHGKIAEMVGCLAGELFGEEYGALDTMRRVLQTGEPASREVDYTMRTSGDRRLMNVAYIRHAPDQLLVVTEDLT